MIEKGRMPFQREDYIARLTLTKDKMEAARMDALLVTNPANITYLTGYCADSGYVAQGLLVRADEEEPSLFLRRMDAPAGIYTSFMSRDRIIGYPENYVGDPNRDGFDFIVDHIQKVGFGRKAIGLEFESISGTTLNKLKTRLSDVRIVDGSGIVTWLRIVKTDREIAVMREAAEITDAAMKRAVEVIAPGVRECDAAAEVTAQLVRGTVRFGGDRGDFPLMPASPKTGTSHLSWTDQKYKRGTHVNIELGGCRHLYYAALMRTVSIGTPSTRLQNLHDVMIEGCDASLSAARPGATCREIAKAFCTTVERAGFIKDSRCGYPIGIDWLEPSASLRTDDPTILQENMTFHLMLGMWVEEDFGAVLSETFRITHNGAEVFGRTPRKLFIV